MGETADGRIPSDVGSTFWWSSRRPGLGFRVAPCTRGPVARPGHPVDLQKRVADPIDGVGLDLFIIGPN